jgi:hypothetical protein
MMGKIGRGLKHARTWIGASLTASLALYAVATGAQAADGVVSEGADSTQSTAHAPATQPSAALSDFWADWQARVHEAQDSQPHWITPIATVTPRLEQEFRYDQLWQHSGNGANLSNFDGGKGLELIPTTTNEVLINLPAYEQRTVKKAANGWGDWSFLTIKQRFASANEQHGNYIVSGFLGFQAPTGSSAFTNHAWMITPTLAAGKGWGDFDVQATVGAQLPLSHASTIGTAIVANVTFQDHFARFFWPELEINDTYWSGGLRGGKNQMFLTPGLVLGRFQTSATTKAILGLGYQVAVSPKLVRTPALTPAYQDAWILSLRSAF